MGSSHALVQAAPLWHAVDSVYCILLAAACACAALDGLSVSWPCQDAWCMGPCNQQGSARAAGWCWACLPLPAKLKS